RLTGSLQVIIADGPEITGAGRSRALVHWLLAFRGLLLGYSARRNDGNSSRMRLAAMRRKRHRASRPPTRSTAIVRSMTSGLLSLVRPRSAFAGRTVHP